ncbi:MAG TPA: EamA family transporter [Chitinophagaceae bacterium]|nr:EamA family transporter [Chitinophagaceae bacterium]
MNYLILSILLNAYIGIVFVVFNRFKIDILQAIVFNYMTCVITGTLFNAEFPLHIQSMQEPWFWWAMLMGLMFISILNLIGVSSVKVGVTVTQTANKLSLIIPVLFSWYLYNEEITWVKWSGIFLAMLSVVLTIWKSEKSKSKKTLLSLFYPLLIFVGSGLLDTLTKYVEANYVKNESIANSYLIAGFLSAATIGFLLLSILYLLKKKKFRMKNVLAGIILGVPNYFSIYYLIMALKSQTLSSSAVIPINNIGVLFVVSFFGILIFKEKMSKVNYIGLSLTMISILLIYFGDLYLKS